MELGWEALSKGSERAGGVSRVCDIPALLGGE